MVKAESSLERIYEKEIQFLKSITCMEIDRGMCKIAYNFLRKINKMKFG